MPRQAKEAFACTDAQARANGKRRTGADGASLAPCTPPKTYEPSRYLKRVADLPLAMQVPWAKLSAGCEAAWDLRAIKRAK